MKRFWLVMGLAAAPMMAAAQDTATVAGDEGPGSGPRPFVVTPFIGMQNYDSHSALKNGMVAAIDMNFRFTSMLALGLTASVGRPMTDGTYFPLVRMQAADTSLYYRVSQRITSYTIGAHAVATAPLGRFAPYGLIGIGRSFLEMDPQTTGTTTRSSGPMFSLGGGINILLRQNSGITFDIRDVVFTNFDREVLNGTDPLFRDDRVDQTPSGIPGKKSTIHNIRLSVGVSFVPDSKQGER